MENKKERGADGLWRSWFKSKRSLADEAGSITGAHAMEAEGEFAGSLKTVGEVVLRGRVCGHIQADCIRLIGAQVLGNLIAKHQVEVDRTSNLEGNISTERLELNGRVVGHITVRTSANFGPKSLVEGDVTARYFYRHPNSIIVGDLKIYGEQPNTQALQASGETQ